MGSFVGKVVPDKKISREAEGCAMMNGPCRICLEIGAPRLSVCKCTQGVHRQCVETWRTYSSNAQRCELCKSDYVGLASQPQRLLSADAFPVMASDLRACLYDPRMCPACHLGPIVYSGCDSLYMYANGRNACSGCRFFSSSRSSWPVWDGGLPPSWTTEALRQPPAASRTQPTDVATIVAIFLSPHVCRGGGEGVSYSDGRMSYLLCPMCGPLSCPLSRTLLGRFCLWAVRACVALCLFAVLMPAVGLLVCALLLVGCQWRDLQRARG